MPDPVIPTGSDAYLKRLTSTELLNTDKLKGLFFSLSALLMT